MSLLSTIMLQFLIGCGIGGSQLNSCLILEAIDSKGTNHNLQFEPQLGSQWQTMFESCVRDHHIYAQKINSTTRMVVKDNTVLE